MLLGPSILDTGTVNLCRLHGDGAMEKKHCREGIRIMPEKVRVAHWSTWAKTQRTQEHHHLAVWAKALQVKGNGSAKGLVTRISKETRDIGPKGRKERAVGEDTKAKQGQAIDWHDTVQHDSRQPREAAARVQHGLSQRRCVPSAI